METTKDDGLSAAVTKRRQVLAGAGTLAALATVRPLRAIAARPLKFKVGTSMTDSHPLNAYLQKAADQILKESDGALRIDVFPNDQLGGAMDQLSQLRSGGLQMLAQSGPILESLVPAVGIYGLAFAFKTDADAWAAMDGALGQHLRKAIGSAGLGVLDKGWANGYRQVLTGTKPIRAPDDMHGLSIRVPSSPIELSTFRDLGASPTPLNWNEVYSALQTKVVDAVEVPLLVANFAKFYEVQKYVSITNHMWDSFFLLVNRQAWQQLPDPLRQLAEARFNDMAVQERHALLDQDAGATADLKSHGMQVNATDADQFREVLKQAGYYQNWKRKYGAASWSLLEQYSGPLT